MKFFNLFLFLTLIFSLPSANLSFTKEPTKSAICEFLLGKPNPEKSKVVQVGQIVFKTNVIVRGLLKVQKYLSYEQTHFSVPKDSGVFKKIIYYSLDLVRKTIQTLSPIYLHSIETKADAVFLKQLKSPQESLSDEERKVLENYDLDELYKKKQNFIQTHPRWTYFRSLVYKVRKIANYVSLAFALNFSALSYASSPLPVETFLKQPEYRLQSDEVQLIEDFVPFPHLALRIGDTVYNYGATHLTSMNASEYFYYNQLQRLNPPKQDKTVDETQSQKPGSFDKITESIFTSIKSQMDKMPRSVMVATIKITPEERLKLKRELELKVGQKYVNKTFVNDCATMVVRALSRHTDIKIPALIDASPSQILFYLASLKTMGSDNVKDVRTVFIEKPEAYFEHLLRNSYIAALESKLLIFGFFFDKPQRVYLDLTYSEPELETLQKEIKDEIQSWRQQAEAEINADAQIQTYKELIDLAPSLTQDQRTRLSHEVLKYFNSLILQAELTMNEPETEFKDLIFAKYRKEFLEKLKPEILKALE